MNNNVKGFSPKPRKNHSDHMKWEENLDEGENPFGFTAQTANGTAKCYGTGWNKDQPFPGPRAEVEPDETRPKRGNRTGE